MAFPGRNDPTRRNARFEREVDNPFTRPQTARASFHPPDRNRIRPTHQIASGTSYVSAHPSPKHLDRETALAQLVEHARQAASRIPNFMSTKPPMPLPPGLSHFSRKSSRTFPCRGQDARTAARPKRIPRRKRSPPWSSKHLNAATATKFSTRSTPPRCCGPNAPTAEADHIRTRPR